MRHEPESILESAIGWFPFETSPDLGSLRMTTGILFSLSRWLAASSEAAFHGSLGRSYAQP